MTEVVVVDEFADTSEEDENEKYGLMWKDFMIGLNKTIDHLKMFIIPGSISIVIGIVFFILFKQSAIARFDDYQGYLVLAVLLQTITFLFYEFPPDLTFCSAAFIVCMCGIIKEKKEWKGLSNPSILAVGSIGAVVKGLEKTQLFKLILGEILTWTIIPLVIQQQFIPYWAFLLHS